MKQLEIKILNIVQLSCGKLSKVMTRKKKTNFLFAFAVIHDRCTTSIAKSSAGDVESNSNTSELDLNVVR